MKMVWCPASVSPEPLPTCRPASKLVGADLRSSEIDGVVLLPADVRGAIVSPAQAMDLARLLGIVIREPGFALQWTGDLL